MSKKIHSLILLLFFLAFPVFHQAVNAQDESYIRGKVIISGTTSPVQFATVRLKENQIGVFANAEGDFRIINNQAFASDSLVVTSIGYLRSSVALKDLSDTLINRIFLVPATYNLSEIKVIASRKKIKSTDLVSKAIKNIPHNYPSGPFSYICYYRDYQKNEDTYQNLNESIVQVNDAGFSTLSASNRYRLLDFRKNTDFPRMDISPYYDLSNSLQGSTPDKFIPMAKLGDQGGNELFVLMVHDAIRNFKTRSFSFIDILSHDFILNHFFAPPEPVYNNNLLLYKVFFNARTRLSGDSLLVTGAIYIQPGDYSIHKIEYSCNYLMPNKQKKLMYSINIEYGYESSIGSPLYLKYISFNNFFRVSDPYDSSYFRVRESYLLPANVSNSTLVLVFNNRVDQQSGKLKENYDIRIAGKAARIKNIDVKGKRVIILTKENNLNSVAGQMTVTVNNVKDINGALVNTKRTSELNQFRELFVQEYNRDLKFTDSCFMEYKPLDINCISKPTTVEKYWMNTPEKIKIR